ncbi:PRC-barrel domain-containing protein [Streptomyces vilmorinianum]|uniref:PRC-barrel domain-containing protein n=1 Tax=Streptomyces vilmorinianum TaxID=3051092 RepID=UPI0010FB8370|nr:PRC-barrel domain-containing protein [Streptomyces vilmorinianum]
MLSSDLAGRQVVLVSTGETLGKVTGLLLSPSPARVQALRIRTGAHLTTVPWGAVQACGPDAVMVRRTPDADERVSGGDAEAAPGDARGKSLMTDRGDRLGEVRDVEFDPANGSLLTLLTAGDVFDGARLVGVGDFAAVITGDAVDDANPAG